MTTMVTVDQLIQEVREQEGVCISVRRTVMGRTGYKVPEQVKSYKEIFRERIDESKTVAILFKRLSILLPGVSYAVSMGDGRQCSTRQMTMAKLRGTYRITT